MTEKNGKNIIWATDDPNEHSFPVKPRVRRGEPEAKGEGVTHTIASYFYEQHGIQLRYPKMPCIYIGKNKWYPLEFITQGFDKAKNENRVLPVLGYHDEYAAGQRIEVIKSYARRLNQMIRNWGIRGAYCPVWETNGGQTTPT